MVINRSETGARPQFMEDASGVLPVFWTADGKLVLSRSTSAINGGALTLLSDAISKIDTRGRINEFGILVPRRDCSYITEEVEYSTVIGKSIVVPTQPGDQIFYACRRQRTERPSRLVKGKEPIPSNHYTVVLLERESGEYLLISRWVGRKADVEPCDYHKLYARHLTRCNRRHIRQRSREFWETHAFVMEHTLYWHNTLTDKQPPDWFSAPLPPRWSRYGQLEHGGQHGSSPDVPVVQ